MCSKNTTFGNVKILCSSFVIVERKHSSELHSFRNKISQQQQIGNFGGMLVPLITAVKRPYRRIVNIKIALNSSKRHSTRATQALDATETHAQSDECARHTTAPTICRD